MTRFSTVMVTIALATTTAHAVFLRASPHQDVQGTLEAVQPVLEKLRALDPKTFGLLSKMIGQAQQAQQSTSAPSSPKEAARTSFLQYARTDPDDVQEKLDRLAPILELLQGLDK